MNPFTEYGKIKKERKKNIRTKIAYKCNANTLKNNISYWN
jgi:hypothetical protein